MGVFDWLGGGRARKVAARAALARVRAHPLLAEPGYRAGAGPRLPLDDQLFDDVQLLAELDEAEPLLVRIWCEHPNENLVWLVGGELAERSSVTAREALLRVHREAGPVVEAIAAEPRPRVELVRRLASESRSKGDRIAEEIVLGVLHVLAIEAMDTQGSPEWEALVEELRGADTIGRAAEETLVEMRRFSADRERV